MESDAATTTDVMAPGDNVILDVNGDKLSFIRLREGGSVRVGAHTCATDALIGAPFGSAFMLDEAKQLTPTDFNPHDLIATATGTERNNADLVGGPSQQLSQQDISQLKQDKHGEDIVKALESGSQTFKRKTEFSQEKYRKKKAMKYVHYITARRPTSRLICQVYFSSTPAKVHNLRPDTLAIAMSAANVGPHARVLCIDAAHGVVAAACVERMGGLGTLCCAHVEGKPYVLEPTRLLNQPRWLARSCRHIHLRELLAAVATPPPASRAAAAAVEAVQAPPADANAAAAGADAGADSAVRPAGGATAGLESHKEAGGAAAATATATATEGVSGSAQAGGTAEDVVGARPRQATCAVGALETGPGVDASSAPGPAGAPAAVAAGAVADSVMAGPAEGAAGATDNTDGTEPAAPSGAAAEAVRAQDDAGKGAEGAAATGAARAPTRQPRERIPLHKELPAGAPVPGALMPAAPEDLAVIARDGFTSLVVAAPRLQYSGLMDLVLPLLQPSASLALYSPTMQPLLDCYSELQAKRACVALQVQESWWREIQVLPARTHPTMSMPGTGGYLLTGIRVVQPQAAAEGDPPRKQCARH